MELIRELPHGIRLRVFRRLYADVFSSVTFFGNKDSDLLFWHLMLDSIQVPPVRGRLPGK